MTGKHPGTRRSVAVRRQREQRGRLAEHVAAWRLRLAGYRILARRFRTPAGEIDIVARRGHVLAIVEVKIRRDLAAAAEAMTTAQRGRVTRAAGFFLARLHDQADLSVRFDLILVAPWRLPQHLSDAWREDD